MILVEADAVKAELVHLLPGFEMFGIGAHRDLGLEVAVRERIGQFAADLEMVELFAIGEQVKDENLHGVLPIALALIGPPLAEALCRKVGPERLPGQDAGKNSTYVEIKELAADAGAVPAFAAAGSGGRKPQLEARAALGRQ